MTLGEFVKEYRSQHELNQREFAALSGLSCGYVSMLENNRNPRTGEPLNLSLNTYKSIARATGRTVDELFTLVDDAVDLREAFADSVPGISREARHVAELYQIADKRDQKLVCTILEPYEEKLTNEREKVVPFPKVRVKHRQDGFDEMTVYDEPSAAGFGNYLSDTPATHTEQYPAGVVPHGTNYGVPISGDSMEPKYRNGGTAFIQSVPVINDGEVGLFSLNGASYIKVLHVDREHGRVFLHSLNPAYEDILVQEGDYLYTFGRVLGSYSM